MSKAREAAIVGDFVEITGATIRSATAFVRKHKTLDASLDAFYNDYAAQAASASQVGNKNQEKKLGEIWEKFKDASDPKLIKIEGTMEMCGELGIDPEADLVLFCLAADLGSKVTGEWEKAPFVAGWMAQPGGIDSLAGMKAHLPTLRQKLKSDPVYFKKVYLHTFDLIKAPGARVVVLDTAIDFWNLFILPVLDARPSALAYTNETKPSLSISTPKFTKQHYQYWIDFQKKRNKAVSKDTWGLLVDFIKSIDSEFKDYDESGAWPSAIDEFVEFVRKQKA